MRKIKTSDFLKGTLSLSLSVIITKIIGVAFKVPLSYVLGDVGMGYFNTAYAIYGFFYILCTAGVPKSMTLILAGHGLSETDRADREYILICALRLFAVIGAFVTLINLICAPVFAAFVGNRKAYLSIAAVAPSIFFVSLSGVLRGYMNSAEKLTQIAFSQLLEGIVKLVFGLVLAFIGVKISASVSVISALAISGITLGSIASFIHLMASAFSENTRKKSRQKCNLDRKYIGRQITKNALPIAVSSSLLNLSSTLDLTIIIKRLVSSGMSETYANALYGNYTTLAVPMFTLVISVLSPIATSYMPRLSKIAIRGDRREFMSEFNKLLSVTLFISVPASLAFYFYSFDLLDVLFSVQSSAVGADMLIYLSFGVCLLACLTVVNTALESQGRIAITVFSLLTGTVVKFLVSYALIGRGELGILGAPIGTVLSYAVSLIISIFALERSGIKAYVLLKLILLYGVGIICFYPPYNAIYSTGFLDTSFASMLLSAGLSCLTYFLFAFCMHKIKSSVRMLNLHKSNI